MPFRPDILAGKAVILVSIKDTIDKDLRALRTSGRRIGNFFSELGGDVLRGGFLGSIASALPITQFVAFQDELLFLQTKLQVTDKELNKLEKTIRLLGRTTSFTPKQVAEAATELAKGGFKLKEVQNTLQAVLDLSRGGRVATDTAAVQIIEFLNAFKLDSTKASSIADKIVAASRLGPLDVVDIGEAFKFTSTTAAELGSNIDDVLASIVLLSRRGLRGTLAGTSLNKALESLATQKETLQEILGISFEDKDFENATQLFTRMGLALQGLSRTERIRALKDIASIRGARAIGPLVSQLQQLDKVVGEIRDSQDEARISAEKLDSRLGGIYRFALSALQELSLKIGATSEGPLTELGKALRGVFTQLSTLVGEFPKLTQTILLAPFAILGAGAAMVSFGVILNRTAGLLTPVISLNRMLFNSLTKLASVNAGILAAPFALLPSRKKVTAAQRKGIAQRNLTLGRSGTGTGNRRFLKGLILTRVALTKNRSVTDMYTNSMRKLRFSYLRFLVAVRKRGGGPGGFMSALFSRTGGQAIKGGRVLQKIFRLDIIRGAFNLFKGIGFVLGRTLYILSAIRRTIFSFSGILTIFELLLLFGTEIPIVKKVFDRIGESFSVLKKGIIDTAKASKPAIETIKFGFERLFKGDLIGAIDIFKVGFNDLIKTMSIGLSNAWTAFGVKIQPVTSRIKTGFIGILKVLKAMYGVMRSLVGLSSGLVGLSGPSTTLGLSQATSPENINKFTAGGVALVGEIGDKLIVIAGILAEILRAIKSGFGIENESDKRIAEARKQANISIRTLRNAFPKGVFFNHTLEEIRNIVRSGQKLTKDQLAAVREYNLRVHELDRAIAKDPLSINVEQERTRLKSFINGILEELNYRPQETTKKASLFFQEMNSGFNHLTARGKVFIRDFLGADTINNLRDYTDGLQKQDHIIKALAYTYGFLENANLLAKDAIEKEAAAKIAQAIEISRTVGAMVGGFSETRNQAFLVTEDIQKRLLKESQDTNTTLSSIHNKMGQGMAFG